MNVFVFGWYDSRGGTVAIPTDDHDLALARFADWMGWEGVDGRSLAEGALLGQARLHGADEVLRDAPGPVDLDSRADETAVLATVPVGFMEAEDDLPEFGPEPIDLYVHNTDHPMPAGMYHPRWDDDAWGFVVMQMPVPEEA